MLSTQQSNITLRLFNCNVFISFISCFNVLVNRPITLQICDLKETTHILASISRQQCPAVRKIVVEIVLICNLLGILHGSLPPTALHNNNIINNKKESDNLKSCEG